MARGRKPGSHNVRPSRAAVRAYLRELRRRADEGDVLAQAALVQVRIAEDTRADIERALARGSG